MADGIRQKLGLSQEDFVVLYLMSLLLFFPLIIFLTPIIAENFVPFAVTLGFILVLGSSVYLLRKYLEVRKLEAQPSAEEILKKQYVENDDMDIEEYGDTYEKLEEIEKEM